MNDLGNIERILETISRKAPPAGLKDKVLSAALRKDKQTVSLNPVFRTAAALSCLLIVLSLFSDQWLARSEAHRLSALLEHPSLVKPQPEARVRELLAELGTEDIGSSLSQWMLHRIRIQERTARTENISKILSRVLEEFDEDQD